MTDLSSIPLPDHKHYTLCPICDHYVDMRDLKQVAEHLHGDIKGVEFDSSKRVGGAEEFLNPGKAQGKIDLN